MISLPSSRLSGIVEMLKQPKAQHIIPEITLFLRSMNQVKRPREAAESKLAIKSKSFNFLVLSAMRAKTKLPRKPIKNMRQEIKLV